MFEYFVKNTSAGGAPLSKATKSRIEECWLSALYPKIVSILIHSAYNHKEGHFHISQNIVFDNLNGFAVRGSDMRARVKLNLSPPPVEAGEGSTAAKHATVDVATSWLFTEDQKTTVDRDLARVLGRDLNGLVYMRYARCTPATEEEVQNLLLCNAKEEADAKKTRLLPKNHGRKVPSGLGDVRYFSAESSSEGENEYEVVGDEVQVDERRPAAPVKGGRNGNKTRRY